MGSIPIETKRTENPKTEKLKGQSSTMKGKGSKLLTIKDQDWKYKVLLNPVIKFEWHDHSPRVCIRLGDHPPNLRVRPVAEGCPRSVLWFTGVNKRGTGWFIRPTGRLELWLNRPKTNHTALYRACNTLVQGSNLYRCRLAPVRQPQLIERRMTTCVLPTSPNFTAGIWW